MELPLQNQGRGELLKIVRLMMEITQQVYHIINELII